MNNIDLPASERFTFWADFSLTNQKTPAMGKKLRAMMLGVKLIWIHYPGDIQSLSFYCIP
jgi:hypothetical protein